MILAPPRTFGAAEPTTNKSGDFWTRSKALDEISLVAIFFVSLSFQMKNTFETTSKKSKISTKSDLD